MMLMMCLSWFHREFTFDVDVSQLPCYDDDNKLDDDDDDEDDDDVAYHGVTGSSPLTWTCPNCLADSTEPCTLSRWTRTVAREGSQQTRLMEFICVYLCLLRFIRPLYENDYSS